MTPKSRYLNRVYESCIDRGLDVECIRLELLRNGIPKTPGQVVHELDNVYSYYGYAQRHAAPAKEAQTVIDREVERRHQQWVASRRKARLE